MGFGMEVGAPGCGMKAEWESTDYYGSGGSMQMMPPSHSMHSSYQTSHHMPSPTMHQYSSSSGYYGPSMHHGSHNSHMSHSSGFGRPTGMHHSQMSQSSMSHGPTPMSMNSMSYDQSNWDNGFARGYNYDSQGMMQNGSHGAKWQKKGI